MKRHLWDSPDIAVSANKHKKKKSQVKRFIQHICGDDYEFSNDDITAALDTSDNVTSRCHWKQLSLLS